jgi:hypothetical protein
VNPGNPNSPEFWYTGISADNTSLIWVFASFQLAIICQDFVRTGSVYLPYCETEHPGLRLISEAQLNTKPLE